MRLQRLKTKFLNCSALLILISCSSGEVRQSVDAPYRTSGVEQYFLPELPSWANSSASGRCFKSSSLQYMDFSKLATTYQLDYAQMVELQAQYNIKREAYFSSTAHRFLKPVEEASFFSNTLEQVRGGVRQFSLPNVDTYDVIWLESYLQTGKLDELKRDAENGRFDMHPPVLFSSCLSRQHLSQWISDEDLDEVGFYLLSAEWLATYNAAAELSPGLQLDLTQFFPGKTLKLITADPKLIPTELIFDKGASNVRNDETRKIEP